LAKSIIPLTFKLENLRVFDNFNTPFVTHHEKPGLWVRDIKICFMTDPDIEFHGESNDTNFILIGAKFAELQHFKVEECHKNYIVRQIHRVFLKTFFLHGVSHLWV